jgi:hypothetical protein
LSLWVWGPRSKSNPYFIWRSHHRRDPKCSRRLGCQKDDGVRPIRV